MRVGVLVAGLTVIAGCRSVEKSPIVAVFQGAGGGDVSKSTPDGIAQFLAKHDDVRRQITPLCQQRKGTAPADWAATEEGKVCVGNTRANFFGKSTMKPDGVAF
jgi:hypothetical protein